MRSPRSKLGGKVESLVPLPCRTSVAKHPEFDKLCSISTPVTCGGPTISEALGAPYLPYRAALLLIRESAGRKGKKNLNQTSRSAMRLSTKTICTKHGDGTAV